MRFKSMALILLLMLLLPVTNVNTLNDTKAYAMQNEQIFNIKSTTTFPGITQPPALFQLFNNDTVYTLLVTNNTLHLAKFSDGSIIEIWKFSISNSSFITSPVAADFNGDGINEISILDELGSVYFINPFDGELIKEVDTGIVPLNISGNLAVFDENGDGSLDAVFLASSATVLVSYDGKVSTRQISPVNQDSIAGISLVDINRTGIPYIVYPSGLNIIAYSDLISTKTISLESNIIWLGSTGNFTLDNNNVTGYEFPVITADNHLSFIAFTKTGLETQSIRYNITINGINETIIMPISLDFDLDGLDEVFVLHKNGTGYFIGASGIEKTIQLDSNATCNPIVSDIDGDGYPDIILDLQNGTVLAIDYNSDTKIMSGLNGPKWPITGDVDGDGLDELLLVTNSGLEVYDINHSLDAKWSVYLHDIRRTSYIYTPNDTDGDGINDQNELIYGTSKINSDTDEDGLDDFAEIYVIGTDPTNNDTDGDKLPDGWEIKYGLNASSPDTDNNGILDTYEDPDNDNITNIDEFGNLTNPLSADTDGDGLSDYEEMVKLGTSPISPDTDNDGMPDGWEIKYGLNPLNASDATLDFDNDGVSNLFEYGNGTSPISPDTDNDGMPDGWEIKYGLNPVSASDRDQDADRDNLTNVLEFKIGTNPVNNDTDNDGMPDGWEYLYGLDPINPSDNSTDIDGDGLTNLEEFIYGTNPRSSDTDNDGMPDGWEIKYGLNPLHKDDYLDPDSDGLSNVQEYIYGTNPLDPDTDNDGIPDGTEVMVYSTNPLSNDTDGDGLTDLAEISLGTNPNNPDTDGDGVSDYVEVMRGSNPLDPTNGIADSVFLASISIVALLILITLITPVFRKKEESTEKKGG